MKKLSIFILWFVVFMAILTNTFRLMSESNTIKNLIGVIILIGIIVFSIKTECFTKIKIKNEK